MVWAEMVMVRNGHWAKWLWAEMTSDLLKTLVSLCFTSVNSRAVVGVLKSGTAIKRHRCSARAEGASRGRPCEGDFPLL